MDDDKRGEVPRVHLALTPDEFEQLRKMLASWDRLEEMIKAHEFSSRFWSHVGRGLKWLTATSAAVIAFKILLSDSKEILRGWLK